MCILSEIALTFSSLLVCSYHISYLHNFYFFHFYFNSIHTIIFLFFVFFFYLGRHTLTKSSYQIVYIAKGIMSEEEKERSKVLIGQSDFADFLTEI